MNTKDKTEYTYEREVYSDDSFCFVDVYGKFKTENMNTEEKIPAIPPEDYNGSLGDWMIALIERGLWNEDDGWYGDVMISSEDWWSILEECENED